MRDTGMDRKVIAWEIGGFFFISIVGSALHFTFELSNFTSIGVAFFSAVNESTWEHLKMVYWPGVIFMLLEYTYVKDKVSNFLVAKTVGLFLMPLVIAAGWYAYTPFTGTSVFPLDLALFYLATFAGQAAGFLLLRAKPLAKAYRSTAIGVFLVLLVTFSLFTFAPPRIFLFEHFDLQDTGEYGILDSYDGLRYFTLPE
jgi:hypothetical protein